jgi:hypothetical protein
MVKYLLTASVLAMSVGANAASAGYPVNISKGEILLEISATGVSKHKASKISSICVLTGGAKTKEDAARVLSAEIEKIKMANIADVKFDFTAEPVFSETINGMSRPEAAAAAAASDAAAAAGVVVRAATGEPVNIAANAQEEDTQYSEFKQKISFSAADGKAFRMAQEYALNIGCDEDYRLSRSPLVEIEDPIAAKKLALRAAIQNATEQAQIYADTMGMQVAGLARVSEAGEIRAFLGDDASNFILKDIVRDMGRSRDDNQPDIGQVEIVHNITADFVLKRK